METYQFWSLVLHLNTVNLVVSVSKVDMYIVTELEQGITAFPHRMSHRIESSVALHSNEKSKLTLVFYSFVKTRGPCFISRTPIFQSKGLVGPHLQKFGSITMYRSVSLNSLNTFFTFSFNSTYHNSKVYANLF